MHAHLCIGIDTGELIPKYVTGSVQICGCNNQSISDEYKKNTTAFLAYVLPLTAIFVTLTRSIDSFGMYQLELISVRCSLYRLTLYGSNPAKNCFVKNIFHLAILSLLACQSVKNILQTSHKIYDAIDPCTH